MPDVDVPKVGKIPKPAVVGIIGVAAAFVLWRYWQGGHAVAAVDPNDPSLQPSGDFVNPNPQPAVPDVTGTPPPQNNAEWSQRVTEDLANLGFDQTAVATALAKYLSHQALTPVEALIIRTAWAYDGRPPGGDIAIIPQSAGDTSTPPGGIRTDYQYSTQVHQIATTEGGRALVQRFSDTDVATSARVQVALVRTVNDPRNIRYRAYYASHGGFFPAGARVFTTVVKRKVAA